MKRFNSIEREMIRDVVLNHYGIKVDGTTIDTLKNKVNQYRTSNGMPLRTYDSVASKVYGLKRDMDGGKKKILSNNKIKQLPPKNVEKQEDDDCFVKISKDVIISAYAKGGFFERGIMLELVPNIREMRRKVIFPKYAKGKVSGCLYLFLDETTSVRLSGKYGNVERNERCNDIKYSDQLPVDKIVGFFNGKEVK